MHQNNQTDWTFGALHENCGGRLEHDPNGPTDKKDSCTECHTKGFAEFFIELDQWYFTFDNQPVIRKRHERRR